MSDAPSRARLSPPSSGRRSPSLSAGFLCSPFLLSPPVPAPAPETEERGGKRGKAALANPRVSVREREGGIPRLLRATQNCAERQAPGEDRAGSGGRSGPGEKTHTGRQQTGARPLFDATPQVSTPARPPTCWPTCFYVRASRTPVNVKPAVSATHSSAPAIL